MKLRQAKLLLIAGLTLMLGACSSKYRVDNHEVMTTVPPGSSYYVMLPKDGIYGETNYNNSGQMLVQVVRNKLSPFSSRIISASTVETRETAFASAAKDDLDYLIEPEILHWEDRATEWSGRPDRITIKYQAFDVRTQAMLLTTTRSASSKWASLGGDHPQDLLPVPTEEFVAALLGKSTDIEK
ncbi:DUF4823 domain-containing protein [Thalassospira sp. MCCC 1A03138]|uniref:DUF4823 domain-containing protein n=1 Tax=Thalassospira sp. MCCC 1A03138 TaxID=1470576 RepID=UPI00111C2918|nr:DUF4823 domain-containing protein [Thalassospira sp. MCCC 1A03138]